MYLCLSLYPFLYVSRRVCVFVSLTVLPLYLSIRFALTMIFSLGESVSRPLAFNIAESFRFSR